MEARLNEQIALVTGASRGLGRAIARRLGQAGAWVVGTATTADGARRVGEDFAAAGLRGEGFELDVGDDESVARLQTFLQRNERPPSILVNNAGIARDNLMLRMKQQEWDAVINTNLSAVYRLSKLCLRGMIKARYGRIVNIGSVVALSGNPGQANYAAAKAGMIGFTRALAKEVGSRGVTVNCVAPGFIQTDMTEALGDEQRRKLLEQVPLGRFGLAEEVAGVVEFMVSAAAGYITGEVINVNGGMYMA